MIYLLCIDLFIQNTRFAPMCMAQVNRVLLRAHSPRCSSFLCFYRSGHCMSVRRIRVTCPDLPTVIIFHQYASILHPHLPAPPPPPAPSLPEELDVVACECKQRNGDDDQDRTEAAPKNCIGLGIKWNHHVLYRKPRCFSYTVGPCAIG